MTINNDLTFRKITPGTGITIAVPPPEEQYIQWTTPDGVVIKLTPAELNEYLQVRLACKTNATAQKMWDRMMVTVKCCTDTVEVFK